MSVFAAAVDAIFADPNMAADAVWRLGGISPGTPVRVMRKSPDEVQNYGMSSIVSQTLVVDVRVSEVASPKKGDLCELAGALYEVQSAPRRDREGLVWTAALVPAL